MFKSNEKPFLVHSTRTLYLYSFCVLCVLSSVAYCLIRTPAVSKLEGKNAETPPTKPSPGLKLSKRKTDGGINRIPPPTISTIYSGEVDRGRTPYICPVSFFEENGVSDKDLLGIRNESNEEKAFFHRHQDFFLLSLETATLRGTLFRLDGAGFLDIADIDFENTGEGYWCSSFTPLQPVGVTGRVTGCLSDGFQDIYIHGCRTKSAPDEDGMFFIEVKESMPCDLMAVRAKGEIRAYGEEIHVIPKGGDIEVLLPCPPLISPP